MMRQRTFYEEEYGRDTPRSEKDAPTAHRRFPSNGNQCRGCRGSRRGRERERRKEGGGQRAKHDGTAVLHSPLFRSPFVFLYSGPLVRRPPPTHPQPVASSTLTAPLLPNLLHPLSRSLVFFPRPPTARNQTHARVRAYFLRRGAPQKTSETLRNNDALRHPAHSSCLSPSVPSTHIVWSPTQAACHPKLPPENCYLRSSSPPSASLPSHQHQSQWRTKRQR